MPEGARIKIQEERPEHLIIDVTTVGRENRFFIWRDVVWTSSIERARSFDHLFNMMIPYTLKAFMKSVGQAQDVYTPVFVGKYVMLPILLDVEESAIYQQSRLRGITFEYWVPFSYKYFGRDTSEGVAGPFKRIEDGKYFSEADYLSIVNSMREPVYTWTMTSQVCTRRAVKSSHLAGFARGWVKRLSSRADTKRFQKLDRWHIVA